MICTVCGKEFDREYFSKCPYCMAPADSSENLEKNAVNDLSFIKTDLPYYISLNDSVSSASEDNNIQLTEEADTIGCDTIMSDCSPKISGEKNTVEKIIEGTDLLNASYDKGSIPITKYGGLNVRAVNRCV